MKLRCPLCERPVEYVVTQQDGEDTRKVVLIYHHPHGEMHFVVNKPAADCLPVDAQAIMRS